jgi:hypothetical protein
MQQPRLDKIISGQMPAVMMGAYGAIGEASVRSCCGLIIGAAHHNVAGLKEHSCTPGR